MRVDGVAVESPRTKGQGADSAAPRPAGPETPPALRLSGLEVRYGNLAPALAGVDLEVPAGSAVALLGPNGAGKTTLLRAISGLAPIHGGQIRGGRVELFGREITRHGPPRIVRGGLAQVMEGRRIFKELTVEENLVAGGFTDRNKGRRATSRARAYQLFPRLAERRKSVAGYLSGGEQQMLAIGRAMMASPRLLLLDEPSLGLAPQIVEQIAEIIAAINATGTSILLVEQNASVALSIAQHGYLLEHGRIVLSGTSDELRDSDHVRASYLGAATRQSAMSREGARS